MVMRKILYLSRKDNIIKLSKQIKCGKLKLSKEINR